MLRIVSGKARVEVLLRQRAFKPKSSVDGTALKASQSLGLLLINGLRNRRDVNAYIYIFMSLILCDTMPYLSIYIYISLYIINVAHPRYKAKGILLWIVL